MGGALVASRKEDPAAAVAVSFAAGLDLLKRLKAEGRSWAELAHELQRRGVGFSWRKSN
ncbi:MAG: hypothetical protein U0231_04520 [Nitrospiraceae bacterium]